MPSLPVLHIWATSDPNSPLPSLDPVCIAALFCLHYNFPEKFKVSQCTNSDLSPSGSLPFLTHNGHSVSSLYSIVRYLERLHAGESADATLTPVEEAQKTAWCSHVEANLGTLVAYTHYSSTNWDKFVGRALAKPFSLPQRYYVPARVKAIYKPRLEAAGLWYQPKAMTQLTGSVFNQTTSLEAHQRNEQLQAAELKDTFSEAFVQDKALGQARDLFERYSRLLGDKRFIFRDRPTTLDFLLSAHILLLTQLPLPDKHITDALASYPALVAHADRVLALYSDSPKPVVGAAQGRSLTDLLPRRRTQNDADTHYDRITWGWVALSVGSVAIYLTTAGNPLQNLYYYMDYLALHIHKLLLLLWLPDAMNTLY
ncbi:Tom37 domain-containing protein [Mycena indigotica]|uniref:Tom37 domain-containing protein n=1 Tax=Mycena indigotica TaxID=2126181 RepID=A0A8H6SAJ5_9AGAR|nr:Tom37 domain-containing protein [Mycena indigotica]KAF7294792.1 Tom37 domain-containing protein [Mycena indigotica]